jgi:hypothetical protein
MLAHLKSDKENAALSIRCITCNYHPSMNLLHLFIVNICFAVVFSQETPSRQIAGDEVMKPFLWGRVPSYLLGNTW